LWYLNKQRKRVSISTIRAEPLIALKGSSRRKMTVLFGDHPVENAHLLHLSLVNDGNTPVALSDYQSPFRIELNSDARILEVEIIETWPADLDRRINSPATGTTNRLVKNVEKSWVELTPILLNPRDEIVLQLLVENFADQIAVSQHVTGIKRVDFWKESRFLPRLMSTIGATIIIFAAFFLPPDQPFKLILPSISFFMIILLGVLLYVAGVIWPKSPRLRQFGTDIAANNSTWSRRIQAPSEGT
jgi:hypothetical protein